MPAQQRSTAGPPEGVALWAALARLPGIPTTLPDDVEGALTNLVLNPSAPEAAVTAEILTQLHKFLQTIDAKRLSSPAEHLRIEQAVWNYLSSDRGVMEFGQLARTPRIREAYAVGLCDLFHRDAETIMKSLRTSEAMSIPNVIRASDYAATIGSLVGHHMAGSVDYVEQQRSLWHAWGIDPQSFVPETIKAFWWGVVAGAAKALKDAPETGLVMEVCQIARAVLTGRCEEGGEPSRGRDPRAYLEALWSIQELVAACLTREAKLGLHPPLKVLGIYPSLLEVLSTAAPLLSQSWREPPTSSGEPASTKNGGCVGIEAAWQAILDTHRVARTPETTLGETLFLGYLLEGDAGHQMQKVARSKAGPHCKEERRILVEVIRRELHKAIGIYKEDLFTERVIGLLDILSVLGVEAAAAVPEICRLFGDAVIELYPGSYFRVPFLRSMPDRRAKVLKAACETLSYLAWVTRSDALGSRLVFYESLIPPAHIKPAEKNEPQSKPTTS